MFAAAAAVLLVIAVVAIMQMRGRRPMPNEPASTAALESPGVPVPASTPESLAPVTPAPAPSVPPSPPVAAAVPGDGTPGASGVPKAAAGADGRATLPVTDLPKVDSARGRGRGVAPAVVETPVAFPEMRAFVVVGRKAEEEAAVLHFNGGHVSLVADKGGKVFAAIRYADITSASFVRAKNPRWSSSLASPPADVDMPGGLFRSSRAWLSLQSPYAYLIVRLNDSDFRQVLQTVTERTGVKVDQLAAQ